MRFTSATRAGDMAAAEQKVIAAAGLISVTVGSLNSVVKFNKPPSSRFLIGSGVAWLVLSLMAESETLADIAKGLALGIMTTIILGEGGGVMSYFVGKEEQDTQKPEKKETPAPPANTPVRYHITVPPGGGTYRRDGIHVQPFHPNLPVKA